MARIGVDLDGVVYDFVAALRTFVQTRNPWRSVYEYVNLCESKRWEFYLDWGMDLDEFLQACNDGVNAGVIFAFGDPLDDAANQLQRLRYAGHTIHIITDRQFGRPGQARENTLAWLAHHGIPYDTITFTADKTSVEVDAMIDDKPENYEALDRAGVDAFLRTRPWNSHYISAWRTDSLAQFVDGVLRAYEHTVHIAEMPDWERELLAAGGSATEAGEVEISSQEPAGSMLSDVIDAVNENTVIRTFQGEEVRVISNTAGAKGSKLARYDLIPAGPLKALAELYGAGAEKYEARNWEKGYDWSLSFAALQRHAWQFWNGEDSDEQYPHADHMAAVVFHAFALLEYMTTHREFDDRPSTLAAAASATLADEAA